MASRRRPGRRRLRPVDLPAQIAGLLVAASCTALVVVRAATAPVPPPQSHATDAQRASFAMSIAAQEDEWRGKAGDDFPADDWSQRDAFHAQEANAVRDLAGAAGVPYEDVLRAIDDDLHQTPGDEERGRNRSANAVPCKPRPIFD